LTLTPVTLTPQLEDALRAAYLFGGVDGAQRIVQQIMGGEPQHWNVSITPKVTLHVDGEIRPVLRMEPR